ncbi:hypothetical protein SK128_013437 [Halocaridina rubra]|uniref:Uncharacterized protein n=1 Tax=Halocaridina rubra TaxID=373956 RepID=A0AAN8XE74_HALRR
MEATKVLTSLLVLTLTGPSLGYPYTRGILSLSGSGRARDRQVMNNDVADYSGRYAQDDQLYAIPEYQAAYRHEYATPQRQRINAEALAALLPYLTANNDDYNDDYNTYSDDDGTWYDGEANDDITDSNENDDAAILQLLLNHHNGRYSLEDLENLEREAQMEENIENQLHALMRKQITKKSSQPLLGVRQIPAVAPVLRIKGQKEEALDIPSTSIRRPVFGREVSIETEEDKLQSKRSSSEDSSQNIGVSSKTQPAPVIHERSQVSGSSPSPVSSSHSSGSSSDSLQTTMTPFMQSKYDTFMKYLERERKIRQDQDIENELQQELRPQPQKRFITEQDILSQELASLKKTVA